MKNLKINHLAVLVIVVLGQALPMLWYGTFATQWMDLNGLTEEQVMANDSPKLYIASIVGSAIIAYALAMIFVKMRVESAVQGLLAGALIGFAFTHLPAMITGLFELRPYALSWLNGGLNIIITAISGLILGAWRKYKA